MFPYHRYISRITRTPWAIHPEKADVISALITERANGYRPSADEIARRLDHAPPRQPAVIDGAIRLSAEADAPSIDAQLQAAGGRAQRVVVLPIQGTIAHRADSFEASSGGTSSEWVAHAAHRLAADESVRAVVLDIDSPGGSTEGLEVAGDALFALRQVKPLVAVANSNAASAAYWMASQAHEIVVEPGGAVGSVGVLTILANVTKALEKEGVDVYVIKFGEHKIEGNPFEPMSDEVLAKFQADVDLVGAKFHAAIARGRQISVDDVKAQYGDGRYFLAGEAKKIGMADSIATLEATVTRLVKSTKVMRRTAAELDGEFARIGASQATAAALALELEMEAL